MSINPDQFVIGGQMNFPLEPRGLAISPNIELGVGDNVTGCQVEPFHDQGFVTLVTLVLVKTRPPNVIT